MPTYTDRATRTLKLQKAERPKIGNGLPPKMDGFEGENRIQMVNGNPRLYYRANNSWYFTGLSQDGTTPDIPTATSTRLGLIKIGSGGTVSSDGTYTATAATPAADDITGGDAAVTISTSSGTVTIGPAGNNSDIHIKGTDNGSAITALTFDMSEAGAATFNNKVVATELDISGDADIDGTLEADVITVNGTALATFIRDTVGTNMVSSNTETGISVTYDTSNDNLDFAIAAAQTTITSIYATDLIMGEDAQTAIDFGTANEIDFKADNAARLTLSASVLYPVTNNQIDLGTSTLEFKDAFFDGTVTSDAFAGPLTGNVTGDVSGNAGTVTVAANADDAWHYLLFTASTSGSLSVLDNGAIKVNPSSGTLSIPLLTISTSLTVQELLAADNIDIGTHGFRALTLTADNQTSGNVAIYGTNGVLTEDSDLTFSGATLTATNIAAFNLTGKLTAGSTEIEGSNFDINGGVITGITDLVVADGGTGVSTFTDGGVLLGSGTGAITAMAVLTDGQMIVGNGTTDPVAESGSTLRTSIGVGASGTHADTFFKEYDDIETVALGGTGASSLTANGVLIGNGTGAVTAIDLSTDGYIVIGDGSGNPRALDVGGYGGITILGTIATGVWNGTEVGLGYGGTELVGETNGKIVVADGSGAPVHLDIGSSTGITILGTVATGTWAATDVAVSHGGTGVSTLTDGGVLLGSGTGAITAMAVLTDSQMIVGNGTTDPVAESGATLRTSIGVGAGNGLTSDDAELFLNLSDVITNSTNNRVITDINGDSLNAEANLTFDGSTLTCTGAAIFTGHATLNGDNKHIYMTRSATNVAKGLLWSTAAARWFTGLRETSDEDFHIYNYAAGATILTFANTSGNATFAGTIYGEADVVAYYSSDPTLKENKELISNPLDKINSIGGYSFDWKKSAEEYAPHLKGRDYGVMADEIESILPELVQTRDNGIRAVKYDKLVPLLIEGIKELKRELNMIKGVS